MGTSPLTFAEAILAGPVGEKTFPQLEHGEVDVYPPRYSLSGRVTPQGQNGAGGVVVSLGVGQNHGFGPYQAVSLPGVGLNLDFGPVVADTYRVTTHQPRYLNIHEAMDVLITVDAALVLPDLHLRGGNAYKADNVIDISDVSIVGTQYLMGIEDLEPGQALLGDVNFDGIVNIQDLTMVAANFDLTSEAAYQNWLP